VGLFLFWGVWQHFWQHTLKIDSCCPYCMNTKMKHLILTLSLILGLATSVAAVTIEKFEKSGEVEQKIYLTGVIEGVVSEFVALDTDQRINPNFCIPNNIPIDHNLARAAMNEYIKDATEYRDLMVSMVVVLGLELKFPC